MPSFAMPVHLYMSAPVHTVPTTAAVEEVHRKLSALGISSLAVEDAHGALAGVVSRSDLLRVGRRQADAPRGKTLLRFPSSLRVAEIMTPDAVTVAPRDPVSLAAERMVREAVHRVYVQQDGALQGVLSTTDVMHVVHDQRLDEPIHELMSRPLFTVRATDPVSLATERLERARITGLVVVDGDWPVGLFSQVEALAARDLSQSTAVDRVMDPATICMPANTPVYRAAAQAATMRVRRIIACKDRDMVGILSGLDFARAAAA